MDYSKQNDKTIPVKANGTILQIFIEDITHIDNYDKLFLLYLNNESEPLVLNMTLIELENQLKEFSFVRINRNTIVNLRYFYKINTKGKRCFFMKNDKIMTVSRRKWCTFKEKVGK